jgi:hypothetical protein
MQPVGKGVDLFPLAGKPIEWKQGRPEDGVDTAPSHSLGNQLND